MDVKGVITMISQMRLEFVILYELKKGTVLANFFGWVDPELLKRSLVSLKDEGLIKGEIIDGEQVILKDIEITDQGLNEVNYLSKDSIIVNGYHKYYELNRLEDWINGEN